MRRSSLLALAWCAAVAAALAGEIAVSPNPARVPPGGTVRFTATGAAGPVGWRVIPARLGAIDAAGTFTAADRPGRGIVRAVIAGPGGTELVGHAAVVVSAEAWRSLTVEVSPQQSALRAGETAQFAARVRDAAGAAVDGAGISWKVVPPELGNIGLDGAFTAGNAGTGRIVAVAETPQARGIGQARITVITAGPPERLTVALSPKRLRLAPGASAAFTVAIDGGDGGPATAGLRFTVEPPTLGTIDGSGNFTALGAGTGIVRVVATAGRAAAADRALVTVGGQAGQYTVRLTPRRAALRAGESAQFTAEAFDGNGQPVTPSSWRWRVVPERMGTITPAGLFTAGSRAMTGRITVRLPVELGTGGAAAALRVMPGRPNTVTLEPAKAVVGPGELRQFAAAVTGPDGAPRPDARVDWKVYPPGIGTITPDGLFTAGVAPRLGVVIAQVPPELGGGRGVASIAVSSYVVRIAGTRPRHLVAGDAVQFIAEVRDAGGNQVSGVVLQWSRTSASPNFGTIDPATGQFIAGTPLAAQAEGMVYVRASLAGQLIGGDGIKVYVHR
ncbi:MAG: hypothetical protein MUF78_02015 [Candidatus Edwardsbacteria bacterium]|jgi:hypothetical protein|nr:hypothetical protein [Candidatus Edwardsbacteria bacterium]